MNADDRTDQPGPDHPNEGGWGRSALLGLVLAAFYLMNGREVGTYDTAPGSLIPLAIVRGDGIYLERFEPRLMSFNGVLPVYVSRFGSHIVSRYPIAPGLLALPLVAPQVVYYDLTEPGWDRDFVLEFDRCRWMARRASAVIAALTAALLHQLLVRLGAGGAALPAALTAALGSSLWSTASRTLWEHGPAALALTATVYLLLPRPLPRWRAALAGVSVASLVAFRAPDLLFALVILAWVAWHRPRRLAAFLPGPLILGMLLVGYNWWFFGTIEGGQAEVERLHRVMHRVGGPWSGNLWDGLAGTLLSPNRGLFVFGPWVVVALATSPAAARGLARGSLVRWLLVALVPYGLMFSKYAVWWGGHCFGPRYWTDAVPLLTILLAFGMRWSWRHSRAVTLLFAATIAFSVFVHAVGAFCYPSSWNAHPVNVDFAHDRLWDWRDTEVSRCLQEAFR
jgi:hypothetical protein